MRPGARLIGPVLVALGALAPVRPAAGQAPGGDVPAGAVVEAQVSGTKQLLQAVSPVDTSVVWVSGQRATFARTTDGGRSWTAGTVPGDTTLAFRDVYAASASEAWLLAAGPGDRSRIYHTADAGRSWQLQWTNPEPDGFYDCFDFWDAQRGLAYGDAVKGELRVLRTADGGKTWTLVPADALPAALPGEGGFAASGRCVITAPGGGAWIAAGNAPRARVFRTGDYGATWAAADAPVLVGEGAGLTSVSMVDARVGTAFGGNLGITDRPTDDVARTTDGGATWTALPHLALNGPAYGGLHVAGTGGRALVAVGPGGADVSLDGGATWRTVEPSAWWGIGSAGPGATWIAGPAGRIARVRVR